jgi:NAD(P)-dependent dehydrogenase (short-subunit alcohol dehydrogenase family)
MLTGKRAVVTGASRGIGLAVARRFSGAGAQVALVARGVAGLEAAAEEVGGVAFPADLADEHAVRRLADGLGELWGGGAPDIVVNAAGLFALAPLAETDPAIFDSIVAVNLRAPFLLIRHFLPGMLERGSGHLVTVGSVAGRHAFPANGAYSASKFGVRGLHAVLDTELRGSGVRATLVEPAATDTPLWDAIDFDSNPGLPPRSAMLSAEAVADAILYAVTRPPEVALRTLAVERT